jgi:hypothetical protein
MMDDILCDCGAEKGHSIGQPSGHAAAMKRKIGNSRALHINKYCNAAEKGSRSNS